MKFFMLLAVAAVIAGGVYHKQVAQYFSQLKAESSQPGSTPSVVGAMIGTSNASNALMNNVSNGVNNAIGQ